MDRTLNASHILLGVTPWERMFLVMMAVAKLVKKTHAFIKSEGWVVHKYTPF
jgi:hypothetical protein